MASQTDARSQYLSPIARAAQSGALTGSPYEPPIQDRPASDRILEGLRNAENHGEELHQRITGFCDRLVGMQPQAGKNGVSEVPTPTYPFVQEVELRVADLNTRLARCLAELDRLQVFL